MSDDDDDIIIIIRRSAARVRDWLRSCWRRIAG
jgi:hypothetical protein